jgi:hypothetical protein
MGEPILRATGVRGVYDNPAEDLLCMLMEDLQEPGSSFRVERLEEGHEKEWAQITLDERRPLSLRGQQSAAVRQLASEHPITSSRLGLRLSAGEDG